MDLALRPAREGDLPFLTEVYNQAIAAGNCTCDTEAVTEENRRAFLAAHQDPRYPLLLCLADGEPAGCGYLSAYRPGRQAVGHVAEVSYYLDFRFHGRGIGSWLLPRLEEEARQRELSVLLAILLGSNASSLALLGKCGYREWGRLPGIVRFGESRADHLILGKFLDGAPAFPGGFPPQDPL